MQDREKRVAGAERILKNYESISIEVFRAGREGSLEREGRGLGLPLVGQIDGEFPALHALSKDRLPPCWSSPFVGTALLVKGNMKSGNAVERA